jgi:hypothetical protein
MRNCVAFVVMIIFCCGCGNKKKESNNTILKKEKMQAVLWDVLQADAFAFQFIIKDSLKKPEAEVAKLQQHIFGVHKTNRQQFYKSLEYYKANPTIFQPMLDSMINYYTKNKYPITKGRYGQSDTNKLLNIKKLPIAQ